MNTIPISPEIWKLAAEVCTPKQLQVLTLRERHGFSWNQICIALNSTKSTAREHYAAATRNVYNALERQKLEEVERRATLRAADLDGHPPSVELRPDSEDEPRRLSKDEHDPALYRTPDFGTLHRLEDD